jgi:hypothetical protein
MLHIKVILVEKSRSLLGLLHEYKHFYKPDKKEHHPQLGSNLIELWANEQTLDYKYFWLEIQIFLTKIVKIFYHSIKKFYHRPKKFATA